MSAAGRRLAHADRPKVHLFFAFCRGHLGRARSRPMHAGLAALADETAAMPPGASLFSSLISRVKAAASNREAIRLAVGRQVILARGFVDPRSFSKPAAQEQVLARIRANFAHYRSLCMRPRFEFDTFAPRHECATLRSLLQLPTVVCSCASIAILSRSRQHPLHGRARLHRPLLAAALARPECARRRLGLLLHPHKAGGSRPHRRLRAAPTRKGARCLRARCRRPRIACAASAHRASTPLCANELSCGSFSRWRPFRFSW